MTLFKAEIKIKLKKGVADPEGANTRKALEMLGFRGVSEVKSVKTFELVISAQDRKKAQDSLDQMCRRLLANPVIHNYVISIEKSD
jgi:phosphoribosylformylglycinamidine synthase PurS subunit